MCTLRERLTVGFAFLSYHKHRLLLFIQDCLFQTNLAYPSKIFKMEQVDRDTIQRNIVLLSSMGNLEGLFRELLQRRIIDPLFIERIKVCRRDLCVYECFVRRYYYQFCSCFASRFFAYVSISNEYYILQVYKKSSVCP